MRELFRECLLFFYKLFYRPFTRLRHLHTSLLRRARKETGPSQIEATFHIYRVQTIGRSFDLLLTLPGSIENRIVLNGCWEPHLSRIICFFMKKDGLFIDVGANIGYHSLYVASSFPESRCISFEPNPFIFKELTRNIQANDHMENITAYPLAVSAVCGEIEFHAQPENSYNRGLSSIRHNPDTPPDSKKMIVEATTLDSIVDRESKEKVCVN